MRLEIETRQGKVTRGYSLKKGALPLSKLISIAKRGFPGVPLSQIKVIGGRPVRIGEAIALSHAKHSED